MLIKNGAEIDVENDDFMTPLHIAALGGMENFVLLFHKIIVNLKKYNTWIGRERAVEILIQNGAQLNIQNINGKKPIELAIQKGFMGIARMLRKAENRN